MFIIILCKLIKKNFLKIQIKLSEDVLSLEIKFPWFPVIYYYNHSTIIILFVILATRIIAIFYSFIYRRMVTKFWNNCFPGFSHTQQVYRHNFYLCQVSYRIDKLLKVNLYYV